jgi:hypothetical protein
MKQELHRGGKDGFVVFPSPVPPTSSSPNSSAQYLFCSLFRFPFWWFFKSHMLRVCISLTDTWISHTKSYLFGMFTISCYSDAVLVGICWLLVFCSFFFFFGLEDVS